MENRADSRLCKSCGVFSSGDLGSAETVLCRMRAFRYCPNAICLDNNVVANDMIMFEPKLLF